MEVASLAALAAFSAKIGADRTLVQGGGGNTSLKQDDRLWVKASGTWLANAQDQDIFISLPLAAVRAALAAPDSESRLARLQPPDGLRPSIETSLHALLPHPVVAHVHSVNTIAWAVRSDARSQLATRLTGLRWAWVPYRRPGVPLTQAVADALAAADAPPDVLVLANHGLVVGAADCDAADELLAEVEERLTLPARPVAPPDRVRLRAANDLGWQLSDNPLLHAVGTDAVTLHLAQGGALYPDHVVFLGSRVPLADATRPLSRAVAELTDAGWPAPVYAVVPDAGVLLNPSISAGALAMLECLALVGSRLSETQGLVFLTCEEVAALTDWEAEAYRRSRDRLLSTS